MAVRERVESDRVFLVYILLLLIFGLAALFSASTPVGYAKFGDAYYFVKHQLVFGLLPGVVALLFFSKIGPEFLKKVSWVTYLVSLSVLALVYMPGIGLVLNGSRSWIKLGSFTFQPSELSKLGIVMILAYLLSRKKHDWENWMTSLLPILAVIAPTLVLVLLQDLGTFSILIASVFAMLFVAKIPSKYLLVLGLVGVISFVSLIFAAPYRAKRITTFLHPELDPKGIGYQMNQAFLAVGSGGFWGLGFGHSRQKFQYLPEVSADTIFAVVAEENGFLVSAGVVLLILLIVWRGLKIAKGCHDEYSSLLVSGIVVWFGWQSFLNIGAVVGALPLTGVPLPFVSHGGSALVMILAASGIVLSASKRTNLA